MKPDKVIWCIFCSLMMINIMAGKFWQEMPALILQFHNWNDNIASLTILTGPVIIWKVQSDTDEMLAPAKMASSAFEVDGYEELTEVTVFWMFDAEGTLTESSKFMWIQLDVAGWFRLLNASDIWRWWLKDADLHALKLWMFLWPLDCAT